MNFMPTDGLSKNEIKEIYNSSQNNYYKILAADGEIKFTSSNDKKSEFLDAVNINGIYDKDNFYNITPGFIKDNSCYTIFKNKESCTSVLLYGNNIYELGRWFGGFGLTSVALADLNNDKIYELYFTCSWGSGLHRSETGYFDPVKRQVVMFDYAYAGKDITFSKDINGDLCIYEAAIEMIPKNNNNVDFANFINRKTDKLIGKIMPDESKKIELKAFEDKDSFWMHKQE